MKPETKQNSASCNLQVVSLFILALGATVRIFQYAQNRSLWIDEAVLARNVIERDILQLLEPLDYNQGAPILFLLFVEMGTWFLGTSERALRLLPFLASMASLPIFYYITKRAYRYIGIPIALALFSASPKLIYYSQEFKQYSVDVLVSVGLVAYTLRILRREVFSWKDLSLFAGVGVIAVFFSHPAILVLAAIGVFLVLHGMKGQFLGSFLQLIILGSCWLSSFFLNFVLSVQKIRGNSSLSGYWENSYLPLPTHPDAIFVWERAWLGLIGQVGLNSSWAILAGVLVILGGIHAFSEKRTACVIGIYVIVLTICASLCGVYPFHGRLILFLVPFLILLLAGGVEHITKTAPTITTSIFGILFLFPAVYEMGASFHNPIQREEIRPLLEILDVRKRTDDRVYVYYGAKHALMYYDPDTSTHENYIVGIEARGEKEKYLEDIDHRVPTGRTWLLFSHSHGDEERYIVSRYLDQIQEEYKTTGAALYLINTRPASL